MEPRTQAAEEASTAGQTSILLVDDDAELCVLMTEYFRNRGYAIECAHDGRTGLAHAVVGKCQLVILDGMLPVLDGFEVLRQLRKRSSVPVIVLTARTRERDRITGLDSGADDYLVKPFAPDELLARVRAVLRRYCHTNLIQPERLRVGPLELDRTTRTVRRSDEVLELTETEFQILELLMRAPGRVVTRDEIAATLYQRESTSYERSVDVHVSHLRKKVEQAGIPLIRAIRGVGYVIAG